MNKLTYKNVSIEVKKSAFQPVDFTIKIESEDELRFLWATFNTSRESVLEHGSGVFKRENKGDSYKYWSVVNQLAYELNIVGTNSCAFSARGE